MNFKEIKRVYLKIYRSAVRIIYESKFDTEQHLHNEVFNNLKSKNILSDEERKEFLQYYKSYDYCDTVYHEFYKEKTGVFSKYFLPDYFYYYCIDKHYNDWDMALKLDNKCMYGLYFGEVKQPTNIVYRCNNIWFDSDSSIITQEKAYSILQETDDEIFLKIAADSEGGHGVYCYNNAKRNIDSIIEKTIDIKSDIVIQKGIKQHNELKKLNPSSVNTIRVLSFLTNEEVKIYSCVLRMGIGNSKVDNASSGGITVGIREDGTLKSTAYSAIGEKYETIHPTSKVEFSSVKIPNYSCVLDLVKKLHPRFPHSRLLSWDIAIGENEEPILIEVNMKMGELDFHQLNNGPLFGDDTTKILNDVFGIK